VLDAGCGTGALAVRWPSAARPWSPSTSRRRSWRWPRSARRRGCAPRVDFRAGDMLDARSATFDHVVAMDSVIHYAAPSWCRR
jgi:magnesium-protoporphyrin O-methyltransferase